VLDEHWGVFTFNPSGACKYWSKCVSLSKTKGFLRVFLDNEASGARVVKILIRRISLPAFRLGVGPFALLISAHALEKTAGLGYWTNRRSLAPET
jgi:hypothetical protein